MNKLVFHHDINATSKATADAKAMVLRENEHIRILYVPKITDRNNGWIENISGCFLAQRKGKNETWEDYSDIYLSSLKKGEWAKFELSCIELKNALNYTEELDKMCHKEKNLFNICNKQVLILDENINKEEIQKILDLLNNHDYKKEILYEILDKNGTLNNLFDDKEQTKHLLEKVSSSNKLNIYNTINLDLINPEVLINNINTDKKENFWQTFFKTNPYYLSTIAPSILQIICDQAYMGAKSIDNTGSSIADFVYNQGINNLCIIEIKTPNTKLIENDKYRENVFIPSSELTSAVVQIKEQKDSFLKQYNSIKTRSEEDGYEINSFDPKCYLVLGNTEKLNKKQLKTFNLYRNELRNVEIITFNELISKIKILYKTLGGVCDD